MIHNGISVFLRPIPDEQHTRRLVARRQARRRICKRDQSRDRTELITGFKVWNSNLPKNIFLGVNHLATFSSFSFPTKLTFHSV